MARKTKPTKPDTDEQSLISKESSGKPSDSELEDLDNFCSGVEFDEMSLEDWQDVHECLDLTVPVFVDSEIGKTGGKVTVKFCRQEEDKKEKVTIDQEVPAGTKDGTCFFLVGQGDCRSGKHGDLRLIIRLKN